MQTGVYSAQKKDGTVYYRANITYQTKHIKQSHFLTSTVRFAICPLTKQYVF